VKCPWCLQSFSWPDQLVRVTGTGTNDVRQFTDAQWAELDLPRLRIELSRGVIEVCPHSEKLARLGGKGGTAPSGDRAQPGPAVSEEQSEAATTVMDVDGGGIDDATKTRAFATSSDPGDSGGPTPPGAESASYGTDPGEGWFQDDDPVGDDGPSYAQLRSRRGLHQLPHGYGARPTLIIALVGDGDAGKSTLLGSIIGLLETHQMARYEGLGFALSLAIDDYGLLGDDRVGRLHEAPHVAPVQNSVGTGRLVFINAEISVPDAAATDDPRRRAIRSLQRSLGLEGADSAEDARSIEVNVLLVDLPGEAFINATRVATWAPVVTSADAFMILQDPMEVPTLVREVLGPAVAPSRSSLAKVLKVMQRTIENFRRQLEVPALPAALVLTKADILDVALVWKELKEGLVGERISGTATLNLEETKLIEASADNYALLYAFEGHGPADEVLKSFFPTSVHLVSAMGCEPLEVKTEGDDGAISVERQYPEFRPRNALDPLVTLLWQWAVAQAGK
jgi:GTPase SAR1 family protein